MPWNHRCGAVLGWLIYALDGTVRRRVHENIARSGIAATPQEARRLALRCVPELGKGVSELLIAWLRPPAEVAALTRSCAGWEHVEAALALGRGVIFLTPHLGSFDIAGRYLASRLPVTFMYRPAKLDWVEDLMREGRGRGAATMAEANRSGVRLMLATLRKRGNISVLPDQAPSEGAGVWADFFGRPAYTMTLIGRFHAATGAAIVMFYGERLPRGRGYHVVFEPLDQPLSDDPQLAARQINAAVEKLVRRRPEQYLWSYNRHKRPAGAPARPEAAQP